jgi:hypothetical protein
MAQTSKKGTSRSRLFVPTSLELVSYRSRFGIHLTGSWDERLVLVLLAFRKKVLQRMSVTDAAAWWGALTATLVLVWDIYKWKITGPIVNVSVSPNMKFHGDVPNPLRDETFVVVEVTNTGDRATTLTLLTAVHYRSVFRRFRRKSDGMLIIQDPPLTGPLLHVLKPGQRWLGSIVQKEDIEQMSRDGYLYCGVHHSSGKKSVLQRVVLLEPSSR